MDIDAPHGFYLTKKVNMLNHLHNIQSMLERRFAECDRVASPRRAWTADFPAAQCSIDSGMASGTITEGDAPGADTAASSDDDDDGGDSDEDGPRRRSRKHPSPGPAPLSRGTSRTAAATAGESIHPHESNRLLRLPDVLQRFPVSKSTWWAGIRKGKYPAPIKIGERAVAWREADLRSLLANGLEA